MQPAVKLLRLRFLQLMTQAVVVVVPDATSSSAAADAS
jgi:hypothetical protein